MAEILSTISLISYIISGVAFLLAVFFWIKFKIPAVIGDLSGRTARKSIEKMRQVNEKSGRKEYRSSTTNIKRGRLTDTMAHSGKLAQKEKEDQQLETGLLDENKTELISSQETDLLVEDTQTELLTEETGLLVEETGLLIENETELLVEPTAGAKMKILETVMLVHTNEVI